jgi:hypothetical protein
MTPHHPDMESPAGRRGTERLLRDLDAVGLMLAKRPGAAARLRRELGSSTAETLVASLSEAFVDLRHRRARG